MMGEQGGEYGTCNGPLMKVGLVVWLTLLCEACATGVVVITGTKDEVVRGLASGLDHLQHQLELALQDRELLMQKLTKVADQTEIDALQRAMEEGTYISPATQRRVSLAAQRSSDNDEVVHMVLDETEGVAVNGTGSHHQVAA